MTSPQIVETRQASTDEWEAACRTCEWATFFHTPQWAKVWSKATRNVVRPAARAVKFDDGVQAIIPLSIKRHILGLVKVVLSSPGGTYGGWLSDGSVGASHARLLVKTMLSCPDLVWRENPYDQIVSGMDLSLAIEDSAQVIDLRRDLETIYGETDRAHHKSLRKAQTEGVTVRQANSPEDWKRHYELYQDSLKRWTVGGPEKQPKMIYDFRFFEELQAIRTGNVRLWLAEHQGKVIAGIVALYWNHHCVTWHGAALAESFGLRPNNMLYWEILKDAHASGYWWFDCNPSGGYEGVERFKEFLGCRKVRSRSVSRQSVLRRWLSAARSGMVPR
jgi:hypothetical protein